MLLFSSNLQRFASAVVVLKCFINKNDDDDDIYFAAYCSFCKHVHFMLRRGKAMNGHNGPKRLLHVLP